MVRPVWRLVGLIVREEEAGAQSLDQMSAVEIYEVVPKMVREDDQSASMDPMLD